MIIRSYGRSSIMVVTSRTVAPAPYYVRMNAPRGGSSRSAAAISCASVVSGSTSATKPIPGRSGCSAANPLIIAMPRSGYLNKCVEGASGMENPRGSPPVMKVIDPTFRDRQLSSQRTELLPEAMQPLAS